MEWWGARARAVRDFVHGLATERTGLVVVVWALLAVAGTWAYVERLETVSGRSALTDESADYNRRKDAYEAEFGEADEPVILVVRPGRPGQALEEPTAEQRERMKAVAAGWAGRLREHPGHFSDVTARIDPEALEPWSLLYASRSDLEARLESLEVALPRIARIAEAASLGGALAELRALVDSLPSGGGGSGGRERAATYLSVMEEAFAEMRDILEGPESAGDAPATEATGAGDSGATLRFLLGGGSREGFLFSMDGRLLLAQALVLGDPRSPVRYREPMAVAETALEEVLATVDTTGISAGLAGEPALELEEGEITRRDFTRSAVLALILVSALFMWGFGSVLRPGLAALCLGVAIAVTFLFTWVTIGHLNVLAMVFTVILVALGIDFAIHFYVHYRQGVSDGLESEGAIRRTYEKIGGALWMDGLSTAAAFLVAWFTDFPGLAELGVIAGFGLLICLAAMYVLFPALLWLADTRGSGPRGEPKVLRVARVPWSGAGRRARVALFALLGCGAAGFAFGEHDFDSNLLALQPTDGEASRWQRLILAEDDRSQFVLATYSDPDTLRAVRARLEALPEVRRTESALPSKESEKRELLAEPCEEVRAVTVRLDGTPRPAEVRRQLFGIRQAVRRYSAGAPEGAERLAAVEQELAGSLRRLASLPDDTARVRLGRVQTELRATIRSGVERARPLLCPPRLTQVEAPRPLRERFVGQEGTLALRVHPSLNTWADGPRQRFLEAVRSVEPRVFGGVVGFHENTRVMIRSFVLAAVYSFLMIGTLLLLWTRSLRRAALAMLPLLTGLGLLLGAMRWGPFDLEWNLGNFFAGPILIGVGIAGGVHLVRGWQLGESAFRAAVGAVTLSSITTMIGFGLLATGQHRGVASLGLILLVGIGFNLVACVVALPAALRLWWPEPSTDEAPPKPGGGVEGGSAAVGFLILLAAGAPSTVSAQLAASPSAAAMPGGQEAGEVTVLLLKPGDPAATPEMAGDFLNDFATWLGEHVDRFDGSAVEVRITNEIDEAAAVLDDEAPALAFVPPSFYLAHLVSRTEPSTPVAEIPRFGADARRWYIVTTRDGPADVAALRGRMVRGPPELDGRYLERVVFADGPAPGHDFELEPSSNLSDDVFFMLEGDRRGPAALILDEELRHFFESDPLVWPELRTIHTSGPVPWDLAVALGRWSEAELVGLREALAAMKSDALGRELLELMESSGFEAVDRELLDEARRRYLGAGPAS